MEPITLWQYKLSFDLRIRNAYGVAFQDFFSVVMEKARGADFIRVRPFGAIGDKGCDGFLQSSGCVYQSFGKLDDAPVNTSTLVKKIGDDYVLATKHLGTMVKEWTFVHNLVNWPAPGSEDTELGVLMELEVGHGETEVYAGVQA